MSLGDQGVGRGGGGGGGGEARPPPPPNFLAKLKPEAAPTTPLYFGFEYAGPPLEDVNPPHC